VTFLGLNGIDFVVPEPEIVVMMLALAAGEVDEDGLALWIADKLRSA
jgi:death on curing protein